MHTISAHTLPVFAIGVSLLFALTLFIATFMLVRFSLQQPRQPGRQNLWWLTALVGVTCASFLAESLALITDPLRQGMVWPLRSCALLTAALILGWLVPAGRQLASLPSRTLLEKKNQQLTEELARIRQANEVIALSEAHYRLLMDTASEGIWIVDRIGRISFANPHLADMLGTTPEQVKGRALLEMVPEAERPDIITLLQRQQRGEAVRTLCHLLRPDGTLVAVQISSTPRPRAAPRAAACR